jgi:metallo-beta-lactamase family protein
VAGDGRYHDRFAAARWVDAADRHAWPKLGVDGVEIEFLGGAGTVTGSKYLVRDGKTELLVDCGLFQGLKELRLRNWERLDVDTDRLTAVLLTHAHIDHSGYLPLLSRNGYRGPIYCSAPTRDLCRILLPDSARIQEEDAAYANRKGFSKHHPAEPLYTEKDARRTLEQLQTMYLHRPLKIGSLTVESYLSGHILGAVSLRIRSATESVIFSGDIGRYNDLVERHPQPVGPADYVVMESTYGNRLHLPSDPVGDLAAAVTQCVERQGVLLIPAFAVGRTQMLLYCLNRAIRKRLCPDLPIFVNSPMATKVTRLYTRHHAWHRLNRSDTDLIESDIGFINSVEQSKELHRRAGPMVIISASGMLTGGRVLHHLKHFGGDPNNMILLAGFQASGSRGHTLATGGRQLKIHGQTHEIRAQIEMLENLSAHADQQELMRWLAACGAVPKRVYLVHGEPDAAEALADSIREQMGIETHVPSYGERVRL